MDMPRSYPIVLERLEALKKMKILLSRKTKIIDRGLRGQKFFFNFLTFNHPNEPPQALSGKAKKYFFPSFVT
jgi:hypothetical protein